ncbi:MAG: FAD-dependent oxidoreductase [Sterolibacterium sp.]|nr:FAD-dependent oxidoreductase [Sterolibacterium sp.]
MSESQRIIVVGAGHAGGTVVAQLRQAGFPGEIILFGDEPFAPYQRPPLSKAYLAGKEGVEELKLRPDAFYENKGITLRLAVTVEAIDREKKLIRLKGGEEVSYDILILATGSRPRRINLPGIALKGVYELRTLADADGLKSAIQPGKRIALIGGGYIGLEVAASAVILGGTAVVIESQPRVLARVASAPLSEYLEGYHRSKGVEILTNSQVQGLEAGKDGQVIGVKLTDGRYIPCDAAVVCVGGVTSDELARAAGLSCDGGVVVDIDARTADPAIFAIGDVTLRPLPLYDNQMFNLVSVPNALEQAKQATAAILGKPRPKPEVPWFWSHQFDVSLQIAGLPLGADDIVVRGDTSGGEFAVFYLKDARILAVETVNTPVEFMAGKQMIARKTLVSRERLRDPAVEMMDVAA